jgi:hypothetical protein
VHLFDYMLARLGPSLRKIRVPGAVAAMASSHELKPLRDSVHASLISITRAVNTLANEDLSFQRTVNPAVSRRLDKNSRRLLHLASGVLKSAADLTSQRHVQLDDTDDVDIQWRGVVDVIDSLLEKSDTCLDEFTGLVKRKDFPLMELVRPIASPPSTATCELTLSLPAPRFKTVKVRETRPGVQEHEYPQASKCIRGQG